VGAPYTQRAQRCRAMKVYATRFSLDDPEIEELPSIEVEGTRIYFSRWYPVATREIVVEMVVEEQKPGD